MKNLILPLFLLSALFSLWKPFSYEKLNAKEVFFQLSKNPEQSTAVVLENKKLFIRNLPKTESFNYVILKLIGVEDVYPAKKCKNVRKDEYDVVFNLKDVPNGTYFIEIYSAAEKYTRYLSYIRDKSLQIEVDDSSLDFIQPLTLTKNKEVFAANPRDSAILDYYLRSSPKVQSDSPVIIELAETITAGFTTDYEKLKAIHDWISGNIWYDYDELYSGIPSNKSSIETFVSKKGVCLDYASLTAALLRSIGIPAKLTAGYVLNTSTHEKWTEDLILNSQSNHVWNEAYVDDRWVIMDTTYDSNNSYKNGIFSSGTGMKNRKYFDITIEFLSADHYIISELDQ